MTHPSVNSIVERLQFDAARCELQFSKGVAANITEAATIISELQAELISAKQSIVAAADLRRADITRIQTAESSLSRIKAETIEAASTAVSRCPSLDDNGYICEKSAAISAIRSLGSTGGGDAEEGSTQKEGLR